MSPFAFFRSLNCDGPAHGARAWVRGRRSSAWEVIGKPEISDKQIIQFARILANNPMLTTNVTSLNYFPFIILTKLFKLKDYIFPLSVAAVMPTGPSTAQFPSDPTGIHRMRSRLWTWMEWFVGQSLPPGVTFRDYCYSREFGTERREIILT